MGGGDGNKNLDDLAPKATAEEAKKYKTTIVGIKDRAITGPGRSGLQLREPWKKDKLAGEFR